MLQNKTGNLRLNLSGFMNQLLFFRFGFAVLPDQLIKVSAGIPEIKFFRTLFICIHVHLLMN